MSIFSWIILGVLGFIILMGIVGFVALFIRRLRRERRGDIFLMKKDTQDGSLPVEIRAHRDYRYKDADVDPYEKTE
ncbi:MAG: hypothetical protein FK732_02125 [Asgard group archaeon]|nr:hypothetical protein [Asgard group archaeon]